MRRGGYKFLASWWHFQRKAIVQCGLGDPILSPHPTQLTGANAGRASGAREAGAQSELGKHFILPWQRQQNILSRSITLAPRGHWVQEGRDQKQQPDFKGREIVRAEVTWRCEHSREGLEEGPQEATEVVNLRLSFAGASGMVSSSCSYTSVQEILKSRKEITGNVFQPLNPKVLLLGIGVYNI